MKESDPRGRKSKLKFGKKRNSHVLLLMFIFLFNFSLKLNSGAI